MTRNRNMTPRISQWIRVFGKDYFLRHKKLDIYFLTKYIIRVPKPDLTIKLFWCRNSIFLTKLCQRHVYWSFDSLCRQSISKMVLSMQDKRVFSSSLWWRISKTCPKVIVEKLIIKSSYALSSNQLQWRTWWCHQMEIFSALRAICVGNSPVPYKDQWRGALMISMICVWINDWVINREAGDLRRYRAHYDVILMKYRMPG